MSKSSKAFWVFLSVVFAVGAIVVGNMYDTKRKDNLRIASEESVATPTKKEAGKNSDKTKTSETKKEKKKETTESTADSVNNSNVDQTEQEAVAQQLINVIIINGQVQSDFTLDDYHAAKNAVDALAASSEKDALSAQITQIETALTNMGISY